MINDQTFSTNVRFFHEPLRLIRIKRMMELLSVSRTTLYRWVKQGLFPKPHKVNGRTQGWTTSQYEEWLNNTH
ncbi:AlpA family phage regulatory protein [Pluralibacter gergoviae]|uniref:helix-turn-helix transcriptional regulator n=1 Tax=Pluralibacter gergoviae TaxID=61647 RepID=UPI00288227BD|nr:AlpA family phage regulatory protein [Pluralibacter gergoviae]ELK5595071.1 AlpA family phage regulatory protein [Pluralibacter gergoviae]MDU4434212.1 AlpA family phage regulatory protein [Pluralibacter gergoviae]